MMKNKNERGALIVEATIVFPVMFLVIFFMIYAGNAYLQKCKVESIVIKGAVDGASYCADPQLKHADTGSMPKLDDLEVYPYRYFNSKGVDDVEGQIKKEIETSVKKIGSGLFDGMEPQSLKIQTNYTTGILYATFTVEASYKIQMPIRLLFEDEYFYLNVNTRVQMPVSDSSDMIRNIDMVWDYMEKFGVSKKFDKLNEMLEEAKNWFNKE